MAALIYARTDKRGFYCGFYKPIHPKHPFDFRNFLWQYQLPGPNSLVHCVVQKNAQRGNTAKLSLKKDLRMAHVPGLKYRPLGPANLPMPTSWSRVCFSEQLQQAIELTEVA